MFAGLLPHDGSAGGGGAAGHGCCREAKREETWERGQRQIIQGFEFLEQMKEEDAWREKDRKEVHNRLFLTNNSRVQAAQSSSEKLLH